MNAVNRSPTMSIRPVLGSGLFSIRDIRFVGIIALINPGALEIDASSVKLYRSFEWFGSLRPFAMPSDLTSSDLGLRFSAVV